MWPNWEALPDGGGTWARRRYPAIGTTKGPITPTECSAKLLAQPTSMGRVSDYIYTSKDDS